MAQQSVPVRCCGHTRWHGTGNQRWRDIRAGHSGCRNVADVPRHPAGCRTGYKSGPAADSPPRLLRQTFPLASQGADPPDTSDDFSPQPGQTARSPSLSLGIPSRIPSGFPLTGVAGRRVLIWTVPEAHRSSTHSQTGKLQQVRSWSRRRRRIRRPHKRMTAAASRQTRRQPAKPPIPSMPAATTRLRRPSRLMTISMPQSAWRTGPATKAFAIGSRPS